MKKYRKWFKDRNFKVVKSSIKVPKLDISNRIEGYFQSPKDAINIAREVFNPDLIQELAAFDFRVTDNVEHHALFDEDLFDDCLSMAPTLLWIGIRVDLINEHVIKIQGVEDVNKAD